MNKNNQDEKNNPDNLNKINENIKKIDMIKLDHDEMKTKKEGPKTDRMEVKSKLIPDLLNYNIDNSTPNKSLHSSDSNLSIKDIKTLQELKKNVYINKDSLKNKDKDINNNIIDLKENKIEEQNKEDKEKQDNQKFSKNPEKTENHENIKERKENKECKENQINKENQEIITEEEKEKKNKNKYIIDDKQIITGEKQIAKEKEEEEKEKEKEKENEEKEKEEEKNEKKLEKKKK